MTFPPELLDQLLAGRESPEEIFGAEGLFGQLKKALAERALAAELGPGARPRPESPQWDQRQDGADRHRQAPAGHSPGSGRHL